MHACRASANAAACFYSVQSFRAHLLVSFNTQLLRRSAHCELGASCARAVHTSSHQSVWAEGVPTLPRPSWTYSLP